MQFWIRKYSVYEVEFLQNSAMIAGAIIALFFFPPTVTATELININTANVEALDTLPGIGPAKAVAIIDYRSTFGNFATSADIQNVTGIGPSTYAEIAPLITVTGGTSVVIDTENADEDESPVTDTPPESGKNEKVPVRDLVVTAPSIAFVNQSVSFAVRPKNADDRLVRYAWYFGDATEGTGNDPTHTFHHAGRYVVMVESYYARETVMGRHDITILQTELTLSRDAMGNALITNESAYEIDLGGFSLRSTDVFVIPKYTVVLPGETLTLSVSQTTPSQGVLLQLIDPEGGVVGVESYTEEPKPVVLRATTQVNPQPEISSTSTVRADPETFVPPDTPLVLLDPYMQIAAASGGDSEGGLPAPSSNIAYLGLAGLLLLGIFGMFMRG